MQAHDTSDRVTTPVYHIPDVEMQAQDLNRCANSPVYHFPDIDMQIQDLNRHANTPFPHVQTSNKSDCDGSSSEQESNILPDECKRISLFSFKVIAHTLPS